MWTRGELKERARYALRQNYWKILLVSLLMSLLVGGGFAPFGGGGSTDTVQEKIEELDTRNLGADGAYSIDTKEKRIEKRIEQLDKFVDEDLPFIIIALILFMVIFFIIFVLIVLVQTFLINPFTVGAKRFFSHSIVQKAEVKEIAYAYDHSYKNIVKTLFLKDMYIFLWTLLFIIPGIVKRYEYQMIPYLLGEHPEMSSEAAFATSRRLMQGNKWKAFVLDLSFIGWFILSAFTAGLLSIFYVMPYYYLTKAALYRELMGYDKVQPTVYQAQGKKTAMYMETVEIAEGTYRQEEAADGHTEE